jgi:hypothetical protein
MYIFGCIECDLRFESNSSVLEYGAAMMGRFIWKEAVKAVVGKLL